MKLEKTELKLFEPVLCVRLLSLEGVLGPHALGIDKLALPGNDVAVQVGNQLVLVVAHSRTEVSDAHVCLLRPPAREQAKLSNKRQHGW